MPEFSAYSSLLFIHVISAIVLLGSTMYAPLARGLVRNARSATDLRTSLDLARRATKWNPAAAFALLGTGIYLGSIGWWAQEWFYVAITAWVANTVLAIAVINRAEERMARLARNAGDGPITAELDALRRSATWSLAHAVMLANDLAMVYVMYTKPALSGSLALVMSANVLALAAAFAQQLASGSRAPAPDARTVSA